MAFSFDLEPPVPSSSFGSFSRGDIALAVHNRRGRKARSQLSPCRNSEFPIHLTPTRNLSASQRTVSLRMKGSVTRALHGRAACFYRAVLYRAHDAFHEVDHGESEDHR